MNKRAAFKKRVAIGTAVSPGVDISRGSIASQKLEHSRMIEFEKARRVGKRLGKKAQKILMESKHFQSSDEEVKML